MNSIIVFCLVAVVVLLVGIFADKVITPWRARRRMERIRRAIREGRYVAPVHPTTVAWNAEGFSLASTNANHPIAVLSWREITRVTAYKRDAFSHDQICIFFHRRANEGLEVTEDTNQWNAFTEALHIYLPGCKLRWAWYANVMQPAFAENLTEIFDRSSAHSETEVSA